MAQLTVPFFKKKEKEELDSVEYMYLSYGLWLVIEYKYMIFLPTVVDFSDTGQLK